MAGVQEALYGNSKFNHIADEVKFVKQRYQDFVIDSKGVEQLIEQYLFQKDGAQRQTIRDLLLGQSNFYDNVGPEIERFVSLFPAHPAFITEFQTVSVVERREILKVLTQEAKTLSPHVVQPDQVTLITADRYWSHIERDAGLNSDPRVKQVKQNVAVLKGRIQNEFGAAEDKPAAERLVEALAVNRLTTASASDAIGLTPQDLKNNLLWKSKDSALDGLFLARQAKRLLDRTREAANGQFLAVSETSKQYYIDPTRIVDYDQDVVTTAATLPRDTVQRYLNELFTRALELPNEDKVKEGRLWNYNLLWPEHNVERPGWLCFNFPNQRSTAKPPKDFYLFVVPSKRITGQEDQIPNNPDETYWFLENFPVAKCDTPSTVPETAPDTFLDTLRKYAAARERSEQCGKNPSNEKTAFDNIAKRLLNEIAPAFVENAGEWIAVEFNGQRKRLRDWVAQIDTQRLNAPFKSQLDAISQGMFGSFFEAKFPDYPTFTFRVAEGTRPQNARAALELLCEVGMATANGRAVLTALGLYTGDTFTPDQSPWLGKVRARLKPLGNGQFLNNSELFEARDERWWFKGEVIEAEWLQVVLAAGIKSGDLVAYVGSKRYHAGNLREFYTEIKSFNDIARIGRPSELPLDLWKKLFQLVGVNLGLLMNTNTHDQAIAEFNTKLHQRIASLVEGEQALKTRPAFATDASEVTLAKSAVAFRTAQEVLESSLLPINSKAKMQNLKLTAAEIDALATELATVQALTGILSFVGESRGSLDALQRFDDILGDRDTTFCQSLDALKVSLNDVYTAPMTLDVQATALKATLASAVAAALKAYHDLHRRFRLDKAGDTRKKALTAGTSLKQLNRLVHIKTLNPAKLQELRAGYETLTPCGGCTDDELLKSAKSLCPKCGFDPGDAHYIAPALDLLTDCEKNVEVLLATWTMQLVKEVKDPSVTGSLEALNKDEFLLVTKFMADGKLPDDVTDAFISAINTVLSGLKRKTVKSKDFAAEVIGDGTPLKADELRERFETWLKAQIGNDDKNTVRFVLDE